MKTSIRLIVAMCMTALVATASAQEEQTATGRSYRNVVSLEAGYGLTGFAGSNLSPWGKEYASRIKGGIVAHLEYDRLWNRKKFSNDQWGVGLAYMTGKMASAEYTLANGYRVKDKVEWHYLAPQLVLRYAFTPKFRVNGRLGAGYFRYHNAGRWNTEACTTTGNGLGTNISLQLEYRFIPSASFAVGMNALDARMGRLFQEKAGKASTIHLNSDYDFRPRSADIIASVRFYF